MTNKLDYFGLKNGEELFSEIQSAISEYSSQPNERLFLFLVFSLNHLREWIAESSYIDINNKIKNNIPLSDEESFFNEIWKLDEFKIINSLCNRGKHFLSTSKDLKTSKSQGFNCGMSTAGDSLDQEYFLIDGIDSRNIFFPVIRKYYLWFNKNG